MGQSESKQPIFEEYPTVDCEDCQSYWTDECDGTPVGSEKVCKAFKATRRTNTPLQIKSLQKGYKTLREGLLALCIAYVMLAVFMFMMWWSLT
jgi:hypothetical protein